MGGKYGSLRYWEYDRLLQDKAWKSKNSKILKELKKRGLKKLAEDYLSLFEFCQDQTEVLLEVEKNLQNALKIAASKTEE